MSTSHFQPHCLTAGDLGIEYVLDTALEDQGAELAMTS